MKVPLVAAFAFAAVTYACSAEAPPTAEARGLTCWVVNFGGARSDDEYRKYEGTAEATALVSLLTAPERFAHKRVVVHGVINVEFEGDQLCLDPGSLRYAATRNCITLDLGASIEMSRNDIRRWNGYYARAFGDYSLPSPSSLYSGSLRQVKVIEIVASPFRPQQGEVPSDIKIVTHEQFMKRHPGYRFVPPM